LLLVALPAPALAQASPAEERGRAFWKALVEDCAVPPGESAFSLVSEAVGLLASPQSEWRDGVGYGVVASCVYQKRVLRSEERRALVERLSANLLSGIGDTPAPQPTPAQTLAREKVQATLAAIRR
jgi:hypothetical protein